MKADLLVVLAGVAAICGCVASSDHYSSHRKADVFTCRFVETGSGRLPSPQVHFSNRDPIVAVLHNRDTTVQLLVVDFIRSEDGKSVYKRIVGTSPNGHTAVGPRDPLPAGNYLVRVSGGKIAPVVHNFTVLGY